MLPIGQEKNKAELRKKACSINLSNQKEGMIMLEMAKLQWNFLISWVTPERIYNTGIRLAIVFSFLCLIAIAVIFLFGIAIGQARDGGIAVRKCGNGKTLT